MTVLERVRALVRPQKRGSAATAAAIEETIQATRDGIAAADEELLALGERRGEVSVAGSDAEVVALEEVIAGAQRERERLRAALPALEQRLPVAREREAADAATPVIAAANEAAPRMREAAARYESLAAEIAGVLRSLEADAAIQAAGLEAAVAVGRADEIEVVGLSIPHWRDGSRFDRLIGIRTYGGSAYAGGGVRDLAVQLPSLASWTPHYGSAPNYAGPVPEVIADTTRPSAPRLGAYTEDGEYLPTGSLHVREGGRRMLSPGIRIREEVA